MGRIGLNSFENGQDGLEALLQQVGLVSSFGNGQDVNFLGESVRSGQDGLE